MSAPPIGMISKTPKISASASIAMNAFPPHAASGCSTSATPSPTASARTPRFTKFWPGYVTGRCGIHLTSCSLPAAMRLPVNVRKPRMTSITSALMRNGVRCAAPPASPSQRKYSAVPTRPAARPPNACESAVRWGTAVSGTRESGIPTAKPRTIAPTIQPWCRISGWIHVASTATLMPVTPAITPRRAVLGSFIQYSAKMNSAVARTAESSPMRCITAS